MNSVCEKNQLIIIKSRKKNVVTCPYCWTDQLSNRNFCYRCGSEFIFLDDGNTGKSGDHAKSCKC